MDKVKGKRLLATHVASEDGQAAFVKDLRVMLMPDAGLWFAKSLEIDYEACGATVEEVKKNFADGLIATIQEHMKMFSNLDKVIVAAPKEAQNEYAKLSPGSIQANTLSLVAILKKAKVKRAVELANKLPFDSVTFIKPKEPAIAA